MLDTLCVFDFDDTLFKSPEQPKEFKGNWKISKESLNEPYVPEIPDNSFWNLSVVNTATKFIQEKNNYCILLTGRVGQIFENRINELLKQKNLNFKEVHLNDFGGDTVEFKIEKVNNILRKSPEIKKIIFWDDNLEYLKKYEKEYNNSYKVQIKLIHGIKIKFK